MMRPASETVSWNVTFSNAGIFSLDVKATGYRQDNGEYIETHGSVNVTIEVVPEFPAYLPLIVLMILATTTILATLKTRKQRID